MPKRTKKKSKVVKRPLVKKTDLPQCGECPAACCHDLTITIKKPRTNHDLDVLMWQLNYDSVAIYVRNRRWHMLIKGACQYLGKDNLCTIYEDRFDICRDHKPPYCEWFDDWYDYMFLDPKELETFIKEQRKGNKPPMPTGKWESKGAGQHKVGTRRRP
jgi:Fe-S-cluster containining protein